MAACFFCGRQARLTRAHLLHSAIRNAIPIPEPGVYLTSASATAADTDRALSFGGDPRQTVVTSLCKECNSEWMEPIERAAAPVFAELVKGESVPPPADMLRLAHWAVIYSALASELFPTLDIPAQHRRAIRAGASIADYFSMFVVWTSDRLVGMQTDLYRLTDNTGSEVHWVNLLHVGRVVLITASPDNYGRIARLLETSDVHGTLGFVGDRFVYVPRQYAAVMAAPTERNLPTHRHVHDTAARMFSSTARFKEAGNGQEILDLADGLTFEAVDGSFDFTGRLVDYRDLPGSKGRADQ